MQLKPGSRWKSAVCSAEVVIVRPPSGTAELQCGGHAMLPAGTVAPDGIALSPEHADGVLVGKRYVDDDTGLEALGAKVGKGSLTVDGRIMRLKDAKPLPASD